MRPHHSFVYILYKDLDRNAVNTPHLRCKNHSINAVEINSCIWHKNNLQHGNTFCGHNTQFPNAKPVSTPRNNRASVGQSIFVILNTKFSIFQINRLTPFVKAQRLTFPEMLRFRLQKPHQLYYTIKYLCAEPFYSLELLLAEHARELGC